MEHTLVTGIPARRDTLNPNDTRHTVIPTPRSTAVFPGWGVRF
jgi:hypothetical protein